MTPTNDDLFTKKTIFDVNKLLITIKIIIKSFLITNNC